MRAFGPVASLFLSFAACCVASHPSKPLRRDGHRAAASFVQSRGVFTDADGMDDLHAGGVGSSANAIIGQVNAFPEEAPLVSHPIAALAATIARPARPVDASSSPDSQPTAEFSSSLPWPLSSSPPSPPSPPVLTMPMVPHEVPSPLHLVGQNKLVEAAPPIVNTQELPPPETDGNGPGNGEDHNDILSAPMRASDPGEQETVTMEGEVEYGLRPAEVTPAHLAAFPTNAPGTGHAKVLRGSKTAIARPSRAVVRALPAQASAKHHLRTLYSSQRAPWRAVDWGVAPSAFRPRSALARIGSKVRVADKPDFRFGPPVAYIDSLMPDLTKIKAPLSPSVVSRPKGWDQCLRFVREIKARGVMGLELVKVFKGTCMPAVIKNQATERFKLMCNSIGGALEPFTAQIDYKPPDVCNAVLIIFHDVNAVDSKP